MVREYVDSEVPSTYDLREAPPVRDEEGIRQVVFRGMDQMVGFTVIEGDKPDADPHAHPWEQVNVLAEGRLDFLVDGERVSLEPYDALAIPPGVEHTSRSVGERAVLFAFWPLREDRLEATAYQAEFGGEGE